MIGVFYLKYFSLFFFYQSMTPFMEFEFDELKDMETIYCPQ